MHFGENLDWQLPFVSMHKKCFFGVILSKWHKSKTGEMGEVGWTLDKWWQLFACHCSFKLILIRSAFTTKPIKLNNTY